MEQRKKMSIWVMPLNQLSILDQKKRRNGTHEQALQGWISSIYVSDLMNPSHSSQTKWIFFFFFLNIDSWGCSFPAEKPFASPYFALPCCASVLVFDIYLLTCKAYVETLSCLEDEKTTIKKRRLNLPKINHQTGPAYSQRAGHQSENVSRKVGVRPLS